jgi:hypothetical protein
MTSLVLVKGSALALVGFANLLGHEGLSSVIVRDQSGRARARRTVLTQAVVQAQRAGQRPDRRVDVVRSSGALVLTTTAMDRSACSASCTESSRRPSVQKYGLAFLLALSAGTVGACAFATLAFGRSVGDSLHNDTISAVWNALRWPLGLLLTGATVTMLFRWCPRRHQPAPSWLAFGSVVSVLLWASVTAGLAAFFSLSSSFGQTYGPLAGMVALLIWALLSSVAVLYGAAVAAQLEAVRAGAAGPQDDAKVAESEPAAADHPGPDYDTLAGSLAS